MLEYSRKNLQHEHSGAIEDQGLDIMKYKDFEEVIVDENNYDTALKSIEELDVYS